MDWIGAGVLAIVAGALCTMLIWVSYENEQHAGLWWSAAGAAIAVDGTVTLAQWPGFLVPFATDAIGPTAAWIFYRGSCLYADKPPRLAAAGLAVLATGAWFLLHFFGPPASTFYASAFAELPLIAMSSALIYRGARTTMSRFLGISTILPIFLVLLNPVLKGLAISPAVSAQIWLAALCPVCVFATCVFLERGLAAKNLELEESARQLRRYRHHLEEIVEQRTVELEASQRRLRHSERLASIGTLTAGLAHQVNNPIGSIMAAAGFAKLCEGDTDEFATLRKAVRDIEIEAGRCGEIVRDMLRFASDRPTDKKETPIDPILERVRHTLRNVEQEHKARIEMDLEGSSPTVRANPIEMEQAVTNVVVNAIQSRPVGARVRIRRSMSDDQVHIVVEDDGGGIAKDDLERVLDPFFTTRLDVGGTGLGLSVAHGIAKEHGGRISIDSKGVGTTVTLIIPATS